MTRFYYNQKVVQTAKPVGAKQRCGSPYSAAFEHARVDQVGAHQSHVDAVLLRGLQLVAQGLVESDGTELTGTVILPEDGHGKRISEFCFFFFSLHLLPSRKH